MQQRESFPRHDLRACAEISREKVTHVDRRADVIPDSQLASVAARDARTSSRPSDFGIPLMWCSNCRTVIRFDAEESRVRNHGRYVRTGASRSIAPCSAKRMTAVAVTDLVSEPRMKGVSGV